MFEAADGFSAHTDYLHKSFGRHGLEQHSLCQSLKNWGVQSTGVLTFVFRLRLYLQQLPTPFPGPELTKRTGSAWRMYAPSPSCCSRVAEIYGAWEKLNFAASSPNAPRGSSAGRRQYRRMKPSALAFTFSRAKKGIPRAKLAVLITKDFCRAAPPLAAALSVATGISAATRRHPGEVCLPWCPFFVTCRSVRHEIELSEGGSLFF